MMRILLVEDDQDKATHVAEIICSVPGISTDNLSVACSIIEAKQLLIGAKFDLLILDIQIPLRKGDQPSISGGVDLLRSIKVSPRYNIPNFVVGLTSYAAKSMVVDAFAENTSVVLAYDRKETAWGSRLCDRIEQIQGQIIPNFTPKQIVILIHGIRTHAPWAEMVSPILRESGFEVIPIRYGYFDAFKFLCPIFTRRYPVQRVLRELRDIRAENPNAEISVIAHSFGTFCIYKCLSQPEVILSKIIFCGSVVPDDFRRLNYRGQVQSHLILNECSSKDPWPVFAKSTSWGYGATGTFGFGTNGVRDRFNKFNHSEYFSAQFVREKWVPYLLEGHLPSSEFDLARPTPSWVLSLLIWFQLKYAIPTAVLAYCIYAYL